MRKIPNKELDARISAFLDKKLSQFPDINPATETKAPKTRGTTTFSNVTALLKPFNLG